MAPKTGPRTRSGRPKKMVRHDVYDPGHSSPLTAHKSGDPCPVEGCGLVIFNPGRADQVQPCPLGRGCDEIPRRFL